MKKLTLSIFIGFLLVAQAGAQDYKAAEQLMNEYFSEPQFNIKKVKRAFERYLKYNGYNASETYKNYYQFAADYNKKREKKMKQAVFKEFEKLNIYTEKKLIERFHKIFRESGLNHNHKISRLFAHLYAGPVSYRKKLKYIAQAYSEEDMKNNALQNFLICLVYSEIIFTPFDANEIILLKKFDADLTIYLINNGIDYSEINAAFADIAKNNLSIELPGKLNNGYFLFIDSIQTLNANPKTSEETQKLLRQLNSVELYPEIYSIINSANIEENELRTWVPLNNVRSMLKTIFAAGEVPASLILEALKISFSESDLNKASYRKLYEIMVLTAYKDFIKNR